MSMTTFWFERYHCSGIRLRRLGLKKNPEKTPIVEQAAAGCEPLPHGVTSARARHWAASLVLCESV
jgi:hypothetical protein